MEEARKEMNYPLVRVSGDQRACYGSDVSAYKHTDMKEEMRAEAVEVIVSSVEKFQSKYDLAAKVGILSSFFLWQYLELTATLQVVKETMDKKFAPNWHCIIGQVECPFP